MATRAERRSARKRAGNAVAGDDGSAAAAWFAKAWRREEARAATSSVPVAEVLLGLFD